MQDAGLAYTGAAEEMATGGLKAADGALPQSERHTVGAPKSAMLPFDAAVDADALGLIPDKLQA